METINQSNQNNPINDTQYTNQLNNIEAQNGYLQTTAINESKDSTTCYAKCCVAITASLLLSPFAICDVYFATTDDSCVNQSQSGQNLDITLHSYLLASGIIVFSFIGILNFSIFFCDLDIIKSAKNNDDEADHFIINFTNIVVRLFGLAWLILGCVLFWDYTIISDCSQPVHDYLFARFILFIISTVFTLKLNIE